LLNSEPGTRDLTFRRLVDPPASQFTDWQALKKSVKSQSNELLAACSNQQFLVFRDVTEDHLAEIDLIGAVYETIFG
jgi:hypothetical protein